jgi:hypothetical protein
MQTLGCPQNRVNSMAAFHRRRKYALLSDDWRHCVDEARYYIRACREGWPDQPHEILRTSYALGPHVRTQRPQPITEGYGPEAIEILRGLDPPPKRSSVEIGGVDDDSGVEAPGLARMTLTRRSYSARD